jgi:hypothetical protein
MKDKLKDYIEGKSQYTPQMNIMLNAGDRPGDLYKKLGEYIDSTIDISNELNLKFFAEQLKEEKDKSFLKSVKNLLSPKMSAFSSVAIFFLTASLNDETLRKMFGEPIFHNHFGEGFDDRRRKKTFASYFVNVDGIDLHIGYDQRGTCVEFGTVYEGEAYTKETEDKALSVLKCLVDLYKEKVVNS